MILNKVHVTVGDKIVDLGATAIVCGRCRRATIVSDEALRSIDLSALGWTIGTGHQTCPDCHDRT